MMLQAAVEAEVDEYVEGLKDLVDDEEKRLVAKNGRMPERRLLSGCRLGESVFRAREDHPVVNVSWYDAVAYANWLREQDGLEPVCVVTGTHVNWDRWANGWRLPTEVRQARWRA